MAADRDLEIVIIGAGFGGIAAAIELQTHGFSDITILERDSGVGGTWLQNSYPGAACDVPSHMYSFSFAQRRDWSRLCSPQDEILDYVAGRRARLRRRPARRAGRRGQRLRAGTTTTRRWTVSAADGRTWEADAVDHRDRAAPPARVPAHRRASTPSPGTASTPPSWDHDYDLRGKRVAVIGTGASAVQFVPEIAKRGGAAHDLPAHGQLVHAAPQPRLPGAASRRCSSTCPGCRRCRRRFIFNYLESLTMMIRHPRTLGLLGRAALDRCSCAGRSRTPSCGARSGRTTRSAASASSSARTSCRRSSARTSSSSPSAITGVDATGVITADGAHHEVDCIIYGTGFRTNDVHVPDGGHRRRRPVAARDVGATARTRTWASSSPASRRCSSCTGRTRTPPAARSSPSRRRRPATSARRSSRSATHGAAAIDVRPEVEAASDRAVQERFAGHRVDALRLLVPRRATGGSSPTGPATCASSSSRRADAGPRRVHAAPAARPRGDRGVATGGQSLIAWSPADHRYWTA